MKNFLAIILLSSIFSTIIYNSQPSTLSVVTVVGGVIKALEKEPTIVKYKRKDCPVCKGKGWYISGDEITKVDCGYCEPEKSIESHKAPPPPRKYR
jgi:hypothetical protein